MSSLNPCVPSRGRFCCYICKTTFLQSPSFYVHVQNKNIVSQKCLYAGLRRRKESKPAKSAKETASASEVQLALLRPSPRSLLMSVQKGFTTGCLRLLPPVVVNGKRLLLLFRKLSWNVVTLCKTFTTQHWCGFLKEWVVVSLKHRLLSYCKLKESWRENCNLIFILASWLASADFVFFLYYATRLHNNCLSLTGLPCTDSVAKPSNKSSTHVYFMPWHTFNM